ncbi:MAG: replicative DNA helicase [Candidatus Sumerlaeia bacterium]|nr:replicative DNA helicase [Candidatus Sumerlaeia bacterium]
MSESIETVPRPPRATPSDTRTLPHDPDAERAVLGAMILDREVIPEVARLLKPEDFFEPRHQIIFRHAVELHESAKPVDLPLLCDALRRRNELDAVGGYVYVAQLVEFVAGTSAAPEHAQLVADKATLRRLIAAADTILREASAEATELPDQIETAERLIFEVGRSTQSGRFQSVGSLMGETISEIARLYETRKPVIGLSTHMHDLDALIGGLEPTALAILAARPSIGKTAFALTLVRNVAVHGGKPVGFFSLEMGADQLNMRLLCMEAKVPSHVIQRARFDDTHWERLRETASRLMEAPIYIDDSAALTIMQLRSRARRLKAQRPDLGLIVVDYLQLMRGPEGRGSRREVNRQQEVAEISMGLKALAKELRVPVLALSQLSRNIEQRSTKKEPARPQLSDLRESGAIEQDADLVMFIHRERKETDRDESGKPLNRSLPIPTEIIVGKNRNGPIGTVNMLFFAETTIFHDALRDQR